MADDNSIDDSAPTPANRPGLLSLLFLSAWCGLLAGLLEIGTFVVRKQFFDPIRLYGTTRHFVWLTPVMDLVLFLIMDLLGSALILAWPRAGRWLYLRLLCGFTLLPVALIAVPQVYTLAWFALTFGVAANLVPSLERSPQRFKRIVTRSFPIAIAIVALLGASLWVGDRAGERQVASVPMPVPGSPNVLLLVMDTVAAGHLSLHGYGRATSTTLNELAERGIQFESAQAASSWTLPSHAAMFTGHWMHDLSVGWLSPLDRARPTLAEYLTGRGYATAGFVANTSYVASDSGLGRGFSEYHDFIFPRLSAFKRSVLFQRAMGGMRATVEFLEDSFNLTWPRRSVQPLWYWFDGDRKGASEVNREFRGWLSRRPQPERPFFAFLNYFDAHYPYQLPTGDYHRFGGAPADARQRSMIDRWGELEKKQLTPQDVAFAASAYDDCIANLDEQIGCLTDRLEREGILDHTWLIIVADHGESFGEHSGIFCHGTSLYQAEVHVPLVIVPPGGRASKRKINEAVSVRDLAATIVDVTGQASGAPFPGRSLARFWNGPTPTTPPPDVAANSVFAEVVPNPNSPENREASGNAKPTWPLGTIHDAEWSYIRREGAVREELFDLRQDREQKLNRAADSKARPILERMRATLGRATNGPLVRERFRP